MIVGDGAAWIWNIAGELFPGAIEIVDLFHAKGRLGRRQGDLWPRHRPRRSMGPKTCGELEAGRIDTVVETLGRTRTVKALREGYLETNRTECDTHSSVDKA